VAPRLQDPAGIRFAAFSFYGPAPNLLVRRRWTGTYTIVGTEGTIEVPRAEDTCRRGTRCRCGCDGNRREELFEPVNQYKYMVDAFSEPVLNRQPVPLPPEEPRAPAPVSRSQKLQPLHQIS
jgi:predicted dehydrogenase